MRVLRLVFPLCSALALLLASQASFAAPSAVTVLMIDLPVDHTHPWIAPHYDYQSMEALAYSSPDTRVITSWHELNLKALQTAVPQIPRDLLPRLDAFNRAIALAGHGFPGMKPAEIAAAHVTIDWASQEGYMNPALPAAYHALASVQHGTAMTGLISQAQAPGTLRTVHFPLVEVNRYLSQLLMERGSRTLSEYLPELERKAIEMHRIVKGQISLGIRQTQARVVNYSQTMGFQEVMNGLMTAYGVYLEEGEAEKLFALASRIAQSWQAILQTLVLQHPDTVFVIAAGNEAKRIPNPGFSHYDSAEVRGKNVIVTGAINSQGYLAEMSNHGPEFVTVAAPSVPVNTALALGGLTVANPGTSAAAALVSRKIAEIRFQHPELSAADAVQRFHSEHTRPDPSLRSLVSGGRVLPLDPKLNTRVRVNDFGRTDYECESLLAKL